jgi:hypothetical protein
MLGPTFVASAAMWRSWDHESFVQEVGIRYGAAARTVAEEIIAWAQRKHVQIRAQHPYASIKRIALPAESGSGVASE